MSIAISWLFLAYFIILFAERIQSLCRIGCKNFCTDGFNIYVNFVSMLSMVATVVLLIGFNGNFWQSLFNSSVVPDYLWLSITAGVMLVSGMVHTEHTIGPVQFAAYGALIAAMVLRTIQTTAGVESSFSWWYSLAFLVVFSMAIPVVYSAKMEKPLGFYIVEAVTSLVLVTCFTLMLIQLMLGNGADLLWPIPVCIVAVGDGLTLALKWKEKVNTFVLIFAAVTILMFAVGLII